MQRYNPKEIEPRWQQKWAEDKIYEASDDSSMPKRYVLEYFPYPSGAAMHVGHVRNYTIGDALARHARMNGYNVLHPMGWDAFGLPAENYAIKTGISPKEAIKQNTGRFKQQLTQMGFGYDWSREITSSDPDYYKWTQWFFLLLFKRGLAYQNESLQWWCPVDKTVLANEQVENGKCWRCGSDVEKKALKQWFFKITEYADRLVNDLDEVDWSESIKTMQRNWIGRSTGAEIDFQVEGSDKKLKVFTTRPDTLYGATFMVVAPEHPIVKEISVGEHKEHVGDYVKTAQAKSDIERQETDREKTGVFTGAYAINPANGSKIPIWVADYVLYGYGTGAIMAVPAHDERDHEFAKVKNLPIIPVVIPERPEDLAAEYITDDITGDVDKVVGGDVLAFWPDAGETERDALARFIKRIENGDEVFETKEGIIVNSGDYSGKRSSEVRENIVNDLESKGVGKERVNYKIRDWLISRQRYWGAPIPMIHCENDGIVPVPDDQLPVLLPEVESFEPSGDGRSPLARVSEFVNVTCPKCGGKAQRETDTMDGFACSSWYFLRFADPHNNDKAFDESKVKYWLPVDDYIGGAEHAVMHLLYARMWTKVMADAGLIEFDEPFKTLRNQGMILAPDGQKMSKSKGNTIEPDSLIEQGYGSDTIRVMELFIGPWNQSANWSTEGMGGSFRFLQRIWALIQEFKEHAGTSEDASQQLLQITHRTIKKVSQDLESLSFNTAIAAMMEAVNDLYKVKDQDQFANGNAWKFTLESLLQLLAPFAPHIAEELWQQLGHNSSIHTSQWPKYDEQCLVSDAMTIAIQVNGKLRGEVVLPVDTEETAVIDVAKQEAKVKTHIDGKEIIKTIYVPGKILNIVVK